MNYIHSTIGTTRIQSGVTFRRFNDTLKVVYADVAYLFVRVACRNLCFITIQIIQ